jgi:hypothetical protein
MSFRKLDIDALSEEQFRVTDYVPAEHLKAEPVDVVAERVIAAATNTRQQLQR